MTAPTAILEKIRKLVAQANDSGTTEAEAEAFATRAAELMARHGVEQALLDAARDPKDDPVEHKQITLEAPYGHERGLLLNNIAGPLSVKVYWNRRQATMVGRRSDIERAEQLYTQLLLFAVTHLKRPVDVGWRRYDPTESRIYTQQYRKAWITGFAKMIGIRMHRAHRKAVEESAPGSALVLANRLDVAKAHGAQLFPDAGVHKDRTIRNKEAFRAGVLAAEGADIGLSRIGGRRTAISC
jgi:hypothetical protein